ncbi:MAG: KH domain-containing protein [Solobacterium sp.]|nr:KH domain-containing protein [Solobacterium sp.]
MMELDKVLYDLVKPMVENTDQLEVRIMPGLNDKEIQLNVYATDEDIARLIGKKGSMATALRQVMSVASHAENKRISIKFEQI